MNDEPGPSSDQRAVDRAERRADSERRGKQRSATLPASPPISTAQKTALNEMIAPIERSTPPRIMTSVVPIAAMPTGAAWRRMLPT